MAEVENLDEAKSSGEEEATYKHEDLSTPESRNPSHSSGSDSDSDSEDEALAKAQIEALETELSRNQLNYDAHVQYIKLLRKEGDIEKLRKAREDMIVEFPMSSEMWREWAKDEITISTRMEGLSSVEKLYERGMSEYLSVSLLCDYLNFVQEHDISVRECSVAGISKARNLFERALTAAGLHIAEGHRIWELYREFEEANFLTIDEMESGLKEKQVQRIRNLFHRQLSVPLADIRSTLRTYKAWESSQGSSIDITGGELDGLSSNVVSAYQKALEMLIARAHHEEQVSQKNVESEKLQEYMVYLKFEHAFGDPARIQILYERALAEFPVSSDLWFDYTQYLDKTFKTSRIVRDVYYRATRNCPWVGELWVRYLLSLERSNGSVEELSTAFERSLRYSFSSYDEYLNIYLTRVDGLRRRFSTSLQNENGMDYAVIRNVFQRASDHLAPDLKNTYSLLHMHSYWAHLELHVGKDSTAARGVWEGLLKISGSMLEAWQGYIAMEIEMDQINEARSLYKRCYSKRFPGTGSEDICHSWVRFEREYGSLESFDAAVQKVTPRLQELQLFMLPQESKNIGAATDEKENSKKSAREKRKPVSNSIDEQPPVKRRKDMDQKFKTREKDEDHTRYTVEVTEVAKVNNNTVESSNKETKDHSPKKPVPFDDQCTAFISNLSLESTEGDLRNFFGVDGGVVDIRILTDKFTKKSRGLAYVDFTNDARLAAALEKNKQSLLGKRLSILKSDPHQGRKKRVAGNANKPKNMGELDSPEASKGRRGSQPQSVSKAHKEDVQLTGRNTFAVPRNVKALGWNSSDRGKPPAKGVREEGDEIPKSNDEFRKMFLKS
ncbi:uncharacterized protein [Primulina huaijiensis]|uniref:uncharacterized protein n=1 Tax=Primulina huaijiensis TaxID=1492673 RepID=UPI003CC74618